MRKLLKSKKALSPVVAAIILIAVTVAVSIAVAAWMGSLTMQFMETNEITITQLTFTAGNATAGEIEAAVSNTGTSDVTINIVKVNGATITQDNWDATADPATIAAGDSDTITITCEVVAGSKYLVSLFTTDGTLVGSYTDTA